MMREYCDGETQNLIPAGDSLFTKPRKPVLNVVLNVLIVLLFAVLFVELIFNSFFMGIYVVNVSMRPTFNGAVDENSAGGDFIYVDRRATPDYGDVVVVYRETVNFLGVTEGGNIIKRAVAFGGDTVEIVRGELFVNGEKVEEPYVDPARNDPSRNNFSKYTVKAGEMFLLGDNRNESSDSREHGGYPVSDLVGVVPKWSINSKSFTTAIYTYFNFTIIGK